MAKKDMHIYVSQLKDAELKTLIATYDIPLNLRPRLPDSNFRMINLPAGDTAIGVYSRIFDSSGVRIPFSSFLLAVLKYFKVHISQLVPLGLAKVITFEVLCRSLGIEPTVTLFRVFQTLSKQGDWFSFAKRGVMSIHDFLCMSFLEKATVREEPHELGTSILSRVADHAAPPAPAGTAIPRASPEKIVVPGPDRPIVSLSLQRADHAAKRKNLSGRRYYHTEPKRTSVDGLEFAREDVRNLNDVGQGEHINVIALRTFDPSLGLDVTYPPILLPDKEVEAHVELSEDVRRTTRASSHASHGVGEDASSPAQEAVPAPGTQPLDTDAGAVVGLREMANVDLIFDAELAIPAGDSPPYTKDDWDEIHGVNLGLRRKELYKDPKVCRTAIDRFPTPVEIHRLHEFSSAELSDRIERVECQLDYSGGAQSMLVIGPLLKEVERPRQTGGVWLKAERGGTLSLSVRPMKHTLSSWDSSIGNSIGVRGTLLQGVLSRAVAALWVGTDEEFSRVISERLLVSHILRALLQGTIARLEPDMVTPSSQPSSATASLRTNTHARHSSSSSGTFGHTSTPEHLKKKKKSVERGGPSAA
ncbi:hypothetical protein Tco_0164128 [Tanacetum coccineum]